MCGGLTHEDRRRLGCAVGEAATELQTASPRAATLVVVSRLPKKRPQEDALRLGALRFVSGQEEEGRRPKNKNKIK